MVIKKVNPMSVAKLSLVIYGLIGLLAGGMFSLFGILAGGLASAGGDEAMPAFFGLLFGVGAIIVLPIFYGLMGFIFTFITALIFDMAAGWVGGIEITVE